MRLPEYDRLDATALAELVRRRELTAPELLEAAIERADARNPLLNAIVNRFDDEARGRAAQEPSGPFAGVPLLLKDLMAYYEGQPLTASSKLFENALVPFDSETVRRFKGAGMVAFGQTNTPELGIMAVTESVFRGPCRNPWNPAHTPGGSSGGSAAAVAARIVPVAHGNDGGGSIRIPASACGLFGLKPTRGRVSAAPYYGEVNGGLVQDHVLTRSVRDSAALLDVLAGPTPGDPYWAPPVARPFLEELGTEPGKLRIAFTKRSLFGRTTHADCEAAVDDAVALLAELGHEVVEAVPDYPRDELVRGYLIIGAAHVRAEVEHAAQRLGVKIDAEQLEPETWAMYVAGGVISAAALASAVSGMHRAARQIAPFFEAHDLLLTPTMAYPPARVGAFALKPAERLGLAAVTRLRARPLMDFMMEQIGGRAFEATGNTMLFNQTGQPAMSVPLYWNREGLPIGIQLAARFGDEATLFRLAAQLEAARPWAQRTPPAIPGLEG